RSRRSHPALARGWSRDPLPPRPGAGSGPPPAVESLTAADAELGRILAELARRGTEPDVLVVSDHGYSTIARHVPVEALVRGAGFPPGEAPGGVAVAANGGAAAVFRPRFGPPLP